MEITINKGGDFITKFRI